MTPPPEYPNDFRKPPPLNYATPQPPGSPLASTLKIIGFIIFTILAIIGGLVVLLLGMCYLR